MRAVISTSTTATDYCETAPCTRTASTWTGQTASGWFNHGQRRRFVRRPIFISVADYSTSPPPIQPECASRLRPTWVEAAASACCARWQTRTKLLNYPDSNFPHYAPSFSPRLEELAF